MATSATASSTTREVARSNSRQHLTSATDGRRYLRQSPSPGAVNRRERNLILDIRNGKANTTDAERKQQREAAANDSNNNKSNCSETTTRSSTSASISSNESSSTANKKQVAAVHSVESREAKGDKILIGHSSSERSDANNRLPSFGTLPQRVSRLPYYSYSGKARNIDSDLDEQRKRSHARQAQKTPLIKITETNEADKAEYVTKHSEGKQKLGRKFSNISNVFAACNNNSNNNNNNNNNIDSKIVLQHRKQVNSLIESQTKQRAGRVVTSPCQKLLTDGTKAAKQFVAQSLSMNRRNSISARHAPQQQQVSAPQQQQQQQQQPPQYQRYNSSPLRSPPMYGRSTMALPVGGSQRRLAAAAAAAATDRYSRDMAHGGDAGVARAPRPASATGNYLAPAGVGVSGAGAGVRDFARSRARSTASLYNPGGGPRHAPAPWVDPAIYDPYGATTPPYDDERHMQAPGGYYDAEPGGGVSPTDNDYLYANSQGDFNYIDHHRGGVAHRPSHQHQVPQPPSHSLYTSPVSPVSGGAYRRSHLPSAGGGAAGNAAYYNSASRFSLYESTRDGVRSKLAPPNEQLRRILGSTRALNKPRPVHLHPQWAYTRPFIHLLSASALSSPDNQLGAIDDDFDHLDDDDDDLDNDEDLDDDDLGDEDFDDDDADADGDGANADGDDDDAARLRRRRRRRRARLRKLRSRRRLIDDDGYDVGPQYLPFNRLQDSQAIRAVDFHPSGQVYAVGSNTRTLRICAYPAEHELRQFSGAQAVAASTNAAASGSGGLTGNSQVPSPRVLFKFLQLHRGSIYCVSFNALGNLLATGSNDQTVHLVRYNSTTHNPDGEEFRLTMHDGTVRDLCFVDDHTSGSALLLSAGGGDNKIYVTDCDTVTPFQSMAGHTQPVMALHHCGGAQFVSGSQDRTVRFWDLRTRQCTSIVSAPPNTATTATTSFSKHQHQPVSGKVAHSQRGHIGIGPGAPVCTVRVDPSGRLLATGHSDSTCMLYDVRGAKIIQTFRPHDDEVRTLSFSPKSYYLLSGGYDNRLVVTDLQGNLTQPLPSACVARGQDKIVQARWHPSDFTFVATSADKSATLYALPSD